MIDSRNLHPTKPRRHQDGTFDVYGQMQKIKEEYDEAVEASVYWADQPTGKNREKQLEELVDLMIATVTYIRGAGYTQHELDTEILRVNCKNELRGYWEDNDDRL